MTSLSSLPPSSFTCLGPTHQNKNVNFGTKTVNFQYPIRIWTQTSPRGWAQAWPPVGPNDHVFGPNLRQPIRFGPNLVNQSNCVSPRILRHEKPFFATGPNLDQSHVISKRRWTHRSQRTNQKRCHSGTNQEARILLTNWSGFVIKCTDWSGFVHFPFHTSLIRFWLFRSYSNTNFSLIVSPYVAPGEWWLMTRNG